MNKRLKIDNSFEMDKRKTIALDFYNKILHEEEHPIVVTDSASFYDIYMGTDGDVINLIYNHYGIVVDSEHFKMPFWKLLDFLYKDKKDYSN